MEPLSAVTGSHVCHLQLQQACAKSNACIIQSFVPGPLKSRYFLVRKILVLLTCFSKCALEQVLNKYLP